MWDDPLHPRSNTILPFEQISWTIFFYLFMIRNLKGLCMYRKPMKCDSFQHSNTGHVWVVFMEVNIFQIVNPFDLSFFPSWTQKVNVRQVTDGIKCYTSKAYKYLQFHLLSRQPGVRWWVSRCLKDCLSFCWSL